MSRKIILNLAISLDEYIADGHTTLDTEKSLNILNFLNKTVYLATCKNLENHNNIHFINLRYTKRNP